MLEYLRTICRFNNQLYFEENHSIFCFGPVDLCLINDCIKARLVFVQFDFQRKAFEFQEV